MSETALGKITKLANAEDQYLIANEAVEVLERLNMGRITVDFTSDADLTLDTDIAAGTEQWRDRIITITDSGTVLTTGRALIFPDEEGPIYTIYNEAAQTVTLKLSGQTGVAISASGSGRYLNRGGDMVAAP